MLVGERLGHVHIAENHRVWDDGADLAGHAHAFMLDAIEQARA
jgi:hypothetical protein